MAQAQEYQGALELASVPSYVEPCEEVDDSITTQLDSSGADSAGNEAKAKAFSALRASGPNKRLMNAQQLGGDVYNRHGTLFPAAAFHAFVSGSSLLYGYPRLCLNPLSCCACSSPSASATALQLA